MPKIVDREKMQNKIFSAFQECVNEKPLFNVSIRDVEKKAGISHQEILYFFNTKQNLIICYVKHISKLYSEYYDSWQEFSVEKDGDFLKYIERKLYELLNGDSKIHSRTFSQICVMAFYDDEIKEIIVEAYDSWRNTLKNLLRDVYGFDDSSAADALLSFVEGLQFYDMNHSIDPAEVLVILNSLKKLT